MTSRAKAKQRFLLLFIALAIAELVTILLIF
ncbi:MAG: hypothetical protein FD166_1428 [Bacteroidetes bacterium]|nr:MAG: hypothetical protein FD166_1428 [Bacteroidota bacterium]